MPTFQEKLNHAIAKSGGHLCVGLDPDHDKLPAGYRTSDWATDPPADAIRDFLRRIVDATRDVAAAFKPNAAFYEQYGSQGWSTLEWIVNYLHVSAPDAIVILDAKREDIGNTARCYAKMAFRHLKVDAITAGPYLGVDSYGEFLKDPERGCFLLCRTSNKSAGEFQNLWCATQENVLDAEAPLYLVVAMRIADLREQHPNLGAVVGATYPKKLAEIREILPDAPLLIPGVGQQGGDVTVAVHAARGGPFVVNSSSGILYASAGDDFADAARREAFALRDQINAAL